MRNLKRVISLALALVMVLGMMVMTTNAATFTDADEIDYQEAIDVISAIGVIDGFEAADGTFYYDPTAPLTREQGAKIVCYLLMGKEAADKLTGTGKFTDVADTRWSAGAIDYCATLGILDGNGDGTFNPTGELKAVHFGKMLLCALGYDSELEGYVGKDWATHIAVDMVDVGLDVDGVDMDATLSRQEAAQMALNTLKSPLVKYDNKGFTVNGVTFGASDASYVTSTLAKEQRISSQTLTNSLTYTVEFGEKYFKNLILDNDYVDEFGRPSHVWAYQTETIGQYVDTDLQVGEDYISGVSGAALYKLLGKNILDEYEVYSYIDGNKYDLNCVSASEINASNVRAVNGTGNGTLTQVFVDHDEERVVVVSINTYLAEVVTDYNPTLKRAPVVVYTGYAANGTATTDSKNLSGATYADLEEGDMLLVTRAYNEKTHVYDIMSIEDAEVISSTVISAYTTKYGDDTQAKAYELDTLVADNVDYETSNKACHDVADVLHYRNSLQDIKSAKYDLYMDKYGFVLGLTQNFTPTNYIFVVGYEEGASVLAQTIDKALIITMDGEMKTVYATDDYVDAAGVAQERIGKTAGNINTWYAYDVKADGTYVIKAAAANQGVDIASVNDPAANAADINSKFATLGDGTVGSAVAYGNASSVYITVDADFSVGATDATTGTAYRTIVDVNGVVTGIKNANIIATDSDVVESNEFGGNWDAFYLYNANTNYVICAVVVGEDVSTSDNLVFFTSGATGRYYDSTLQDFYVTYNVIKGGEKTTIKVLDDCATAINTDPTNCLYLATFTADGYVKAVAPRMTHKAENSKRNAEERYTFDQDVDGLTNLKLIGSTLHIDPLDNDHYVIIDEDCKIYLDSAVDYAGYIEYPTVKAALGALAGGNYAIVQVATVCDANTGFAKTLIFTERSTVATITPPAAVYKDYEVDLSNPAAVHVDIHNGASEYVYDVLAAIQSALLDAGYEITEVTKSGTAYTFKTARDVNGLSVPADDFVWDVASVTDYAVNVLTGGEVTDLIGGGDPVYDVANDAEIFALGDGAYVFDEHVNSWSVGNDPAEAIVYVVFTMAASDDVYINVADTNGVIVNTNVYSAAPVGVNYHAETTNGWISNSDGKYTMTLDDSSGTNIATYVLTVKDGKIVAIR